MGASNDPAAALGELLGVERLQALAMCQALQDDLDSMVEASVSSNADDEHDPEGATVAFERAQILALRAQARSRLSEIDRAVQRWHHGTYGICEGCGDPIPVERLLARPAATTCLRCAERSARH